MIITVTGRHMEVTPALKTYAEQKAAKLAKFYDQITGIEVVFNATKVGADVEIILKAERVEPFIAHQAEGDAYACIDGCVHRLERAISEHKDRQRNRKH